MREVTGLVQEEVVSSQVLVIKRDIMVKLISGLSLVGVAPEDIQEVKRPQARLYVIDVVNLVT